MQSALIHYIHSHSPRSPLRIVRSLTYIFYIFLKFTNLENYFLYNAWTYRVSMSIYAMISVYLGREQIMVKRSEFKWMFL